MAQTQLGATIVISGRVDNTFGRIGDALTVLGNQVNEISEKLIHLGEESINIYRDYEDNMLAAQVALATTYGRNTTELMDVMKGLNIAAQEWAATTIFHTDDVSLAISNAAHAGWNYEEILIGIPAAMQIAMAGQMDLSDALDMVIKILNATGLQFEDVIPLIDQWGYAANSSATNIDEMGMAMMRMGSTMQFADNTAELMAMIGVLADYGTTGSAAGTLLRNVMIRLIAPTTKAKGAMEELGLVGEDVDEAFADINDDTYAAMQRLESFGFSVYDQEGNLRSFYDIFTDLRTALIAIGGEDWQNNQDALGLLSAIFPQRTITGAINLINSLDGTWQHLYKGITENSSGYGEYGAVTMMSGYTGAIETMNSKIEALKSKFGEFIQGDIISATEFIGGFVDSINGLDDESFAALTGGLEALAAIGPGLLLAGAATKLIGTIIDGGWVSVVALGGIAILMVANALNKINEIKWKEKFGTMALDVETLTTDLATFKTTFDLQKAQLLQFDQQLEETEEKYENIGNDLVGKITNYAVGGVALTQPQIDELLVLGNDIQGYVIQGITQANANELSFLNILWGNGNLSGETYGELVEGVNAGYASLQAEAYAIGEDLRHQMVAALEDGVIDANEQKAITATMDRYNQIMAEIQYGINGSERYKLLKKAQSVSWDSFSDYMGEVQSGMEKDLNDLEDIYLTRWGQMEYWHEKGYIDDDAWDEFTTGYEADLAEKRQGITDKYGEAASRAVYALLDPQQYELLTLAGNWVKSGYDNSILEDWIRNGGDVQALEDLFYGENGDIFAKGGKLMSLLKDYKGNDAADFIMSAVNDNNIPIMISALWGVLSKIGTETPKSENGDPISHGEHRTETFTPGEYGATSGRAMRPATYVPLAIGDPTKSISTFTEEQQRYLDEHPLAIKAVIHKSINFSGILQELLDASGGGHGFAEGGRATTASIFGEAGPEWAVPEEHSNRTADLLNAARAASGFTWGELIARNGGLNAGNSGGVVYSPNITVNGGDTSGLEDILKRDKVRLDRWWREHEREQAITAYA